MKKILFLAYFFPPVGGSGVQRSVKFALYLLQFGYLPVVVTAPGPSDDRWTPDDRTLLEEVPSEVEVNRIANLYAKESSRALKVKRLLHLHGNFSKWWIKESKSLAEKVLARGDIKAIYASLSPFESADVAAYLSTKFRIPWVADLRDPWALREVEIYPSFVHRRIELMKMYSLLSTASAIIMNTREAGVVLKKQFPNLEKKIVAVITNGFDPKDFADTGPRLSDGKFRIVYTGTFYSDVGLAQLRKRALHRILGGIYNESNLLGRSPFFLFKALKAWIKQDPGIHHNLEIIFAGVPTDKDFSLARESGLSDIIRFTGYIPHKETISLIMSADVLFLCMHDVAEGKRATTVGGKDYEYMASGRPILAAVPEGDAKDFLTKSGNAFICRPDGHVEMTRILTCLYEGWKRGDPIVATNKEFLSQFERRNLTRSLAGVFDQVLG